MATEDGRAHIWYADGNGNVAGYTKSVDEIAGTIIDAYNEHFGTDIQIWTPETKTLQVGGTVPNWDAYEKIEIQEIPIKVLVSIGNGFTFGSIFVESGRYDLESKQNEDNKVYILDNNGVVTGLNNYSDSFGNYILSRINTEYPTINSVIQVFNENLKIGDQIDISEFIKI